MSKPKTDITELKVTDENLTAVADKVNEIIEHLGTMNKKYDRFEEWAQEQKKAIHDFSFWLRHESYQNRYLEYDKIINEMLVLFPDTLSEKDFEK